MKNNLTLFLTIGAAFLLAVFAFKPAPSAAQNSKPEVSPQPYSTDDGMTFPISFLAAVTLGQNQLLRFTVVSRDARLIRVRVRRFEYGAPVCANGVCLSETLTQAFTGGVTLATGEAASFDIPNTAYGVRGIVFSTSREATVNTEIIDASTGEVVTILNNKNPDSNKNETVN